MDMRPLIYGPEYEFQKCPKNNCQHCTVKPKVNAGSVDCCSLTSFNHPFLPCISFTSQGRKQMYNNGIKLESNPKPTINSTP
jgi:hypothetical protein